MHAPPYDHQAELVRPAPWRPAVLVLDDEWSILDRIKSSLQDSYEVVTTSQVEEAMRAMGNRPFDVVLTDLRMPEMDGLSLVSELKSRYPETQYILMTAFSDIEDTISAIRLGVADYLRKPFTMSEVRHALGRCLEQRRLRREVASLRAGGRVTLADIVASNPRMREVLHLAETVASTDVTVLINGETGTGKGLLARALHNSSPRADHPYVEINCAAIPATLIESELFGHERGSFTGAVARKLGRVEVADQGTLLLDEVGEMSLDMQAKLLRFLQEFSFERVGGNKKLQADVRVVAATNRDLRQAVQQGLFRQDLYYRLHVIHLEIPPLRERPEDIPLLAEYFLQRFSLKYGKQVQGFSPHAARQLANHPWPGNVRELEHTLERAVILGRGSQVERLELEGEARQDAAASQPNILASPLLDSGPTAPETAGVEPEVPLGDYLDQREKEYLVALLHKYRGNIGATANFAGVNPKTLYLKMNRHGLTKEQFKVAKRRPFKPKP
ncbi:MAG: sigma-54 dependent transcriptional regulator [Desulfarculus sp.]|nr:sigma-54 dependent transcriptional regulator [Desulfarculus sp.]